MARKTNCTKGKYDYARVSAVVGYRPDGKAIQKDFYGATMTEAKAKRDAFKESIKSGLDVNLAQQRLGDALKVWLFEVKQKDAKIKATTMERYESIQRIYIEETDFAYLKVSEVKALHIQRHLNGMVDAGVSWSVANRTRIFLNMFYKYAVEEGYAVKNPCTSVVVPGAKEKPDEIEILSNDEVERIKEATKNHRWRFLILLALGTGLRRGELLALSYSDIKNGVIHVTKSLAKPQTFDGKGVSQGRDFVVWEPKSNTSVRQVPVPSALMPELEKHKQRQLKEWKAAGRSGSPEYIFLSEQGNFVDPTNFARSYSRLLKKSGVEYKKFHALRHTYITRLLLAGVPLPTAQKLAGHADIAVTNIYAHSTMDDKLAAAEKLNSLFS